MYKWMNYCKLTYLNNPKYSRLIISKSKGLSEILWDIRTTTYQIHRIEEKIDWPHFTNEYVIWLLKLKIYWEYFEKDMTPEVKRYIENIVEKRKISPLLLWSNFSSFP